MRAIIAATLAIGLLASGCITAPSPGSSPSPTLAPPSTADFVEVLPTNEMLFAKRPINVATSFSNDLYEPLIDVSDTGVIYVAAHVIAAITTGTPAYYSRDDGATWQPLPFANNVQTPPPGQGSAPPPGDEGHIVAGDNGQAWMTDITLGAYPVTGWCDNGARQCYHNPNAYDRQESTTTCRPGSVNDRPWAAYANGTLLMVNNAGGGPVQVGVLKVPRPQAAEVGGGKWNMCASKAGGIPGVPGIRGDGFFAVPQLDSAAKKMHVTLGYASDVKKTREVDVFDVTARALVPNFGSASFDQDGVLYAMTINNTAGAGQFEAKDGLLKIAASTDDGVTFEVRTFDVGKPVRFYYLDGNRWGPGALATWSVTGGGSEVDEWFAGHVVLDADGAPTLANVSPVGMTRGAIGDVMGSSLGPDGRAYVVTHEGGFTGALGKPLAVWVQEKGTATLPTAPAA